MSGLTAELPVDVPDPTDNGRLSEEAAQRIRESSAFLPFGLAAVICLWCAYLVFAALLWSRRGAWSLLLVPTVGAYLFSWLAFYRHELWHRYFPFIDNGAWYNFVSYLLFSDPQVYRAAHSLHHRYVHTPDDIEFFCRDWLTDRRRRKRQFILELLFGNAAWELSTFWRLRRQGRATSKAHLHSVVKRLIVFLGLMSLAESLEPGAGWFFASLSTVSIWFGALMNRHVQWIEHLGIVSDGSLAERNLLTRNLSSSTFFGWLFNTLYHDDAKEHVFHHTEPKLNSRGLAGLSLPPGAQTITLGEYPRMLWSFYRSL
jgi:hypothetical protein